MQLSVALDLHFGWDSQLNTSEMFWIDISKWMISSRCSWISVYLFWRTSHAFEPLPFFCNIVSVVRESLGRSSNGVRESEKRRRKKEYERRRSPRPSLVAYMGGGGGEWDLAAAVWPGVA